MITSGLSSLAAENCFLVALMRAQEHSGQAAGPQVFHWAAVSFSR